jgi:hypothetical protein
MYILHRTFACLLTCSLAPVHRDFSMGGITTSHTKIRSLPVHNLLGDEQAGPTCAGEVAHPSHNLFKFNL